MPKSSKPPKPPKPPKADRSNRYSIEIAQKTVRVIRSNAAGAIIGYGTANLPANLPEEINKNYELILAQTIRKAAGAAKIPWGVGVGCVLVTGGPHVIIRRFSWPEMSVAAIKSNALTEIAPFLPDDPSTFAISHRIVRRAVKEDSTYPVIDVIVAAISLNISRAYTKAAKKAGFKINHIDVIENARGKLAHACDINRLLPEESRGEEVSYAILDIGNPQINMSIYLDGVFYSNRYFSVFTDQEEAPPEDMFDVPAEVNYDALVTEVASIIDYIQYRERNSSIKCMLLLGDDIKFFDLCESLKESLEIPIFVTSEWLLPGVKGRKYNLKNILSHLDTYSAALPVAANLGPDLDLRPPRVAGVGRRVILPLFLTLLILGAIVAAGVFIPLNMLADIEAQERELDAQLARFSVTFGDISELNREIVLYGAIVNDVESLYRTWPQARVVIPAFFGLEENGQVFNSFNVSGGDINVSGRGRNFRQLADTLIWLRENELFEYADISSVSASLEDSNQLPPIDVLLAMYGDNMEVLQQLLENSLDTYTNFSMNIQLQRGGGER